MKKILTNKYGRVYGLANAAFVIFLILNQGCSVFIPDPSRKNTKNNNYSFSIDENIWQKTSPDSSDYAFKSKKSNGHLIFNSVCKKYQSNSLENLSRNLLHGIKSIKYELQEKRKFANREAFYNAGKGKLDGVDFYFHILSVNRNRCLYDFAIISAKSSISKDELESFETTLKSVRFQK